MLALVPAVAIADGYRGLTLEQALDRLRRDGLALVWSSDLVKPWMRVAEEPQAGDARATLGQLLAPWEIAVRDGPGGTLLLVRKPSAAPRRAAPGAPLRPAPAPLDEVVVSASHYRFGAPALVPPAVFTAADLELLPDLGEDPMRAVSRLPGVARADFSSRTQLRGGASNETLVRFDDLRLYNPFHFKDFLGVFSTIDPGIVSDVSVYTGGFPVSFGDRSSGVIDIRPRLTGDALQGQALLSLLSAGVTAGRSFNGGSSDWLVSARRGNMDLFFDVASQTNLGRPKYHDLYARVGHRLSDTLAVSANLLAFNDRLEAFDSDREERARAEYRDHYGWLRADFGSGDGAGGRLLLARTRLASERAGNAVLPGVASGSLEDRRRFTIDSLQADGWWRLGERSLLQAGAEARRLRGHYRYEDEVEFDVLFLLPGAPDGTGRTRSLALRPSGTQYGAYVNWRWELLPTLVADLGLRWDRETLADDGAQLSPRAVLMWQPAEGTRLRVGGGRYWQAQGIDELAVPDGETRHAPAQRATQWVLSVEQRLAEGLVLRAEAYRKDYDRPLPRWENLLNTLVVLPELKPDRIPVRPERARADGVELSLALERGPLSGWLSYSWARAVDVIGGEEVRRGWDQPHYASGGLAWRGAKWELSVAGTWHRGWPTTGVGIIEFEPVPLVSAGPRNALRIGDYARLDLRVARRVELADGSELSFFAEVHNLLRRGNDCCVEYEVEDEDEGLVFDVQRRRSLPLVPSLGVVWKF